MEKRLLLFFALTFLIVSLWWRVFPPPAPAIESAAPGESAGATPGPDIDRATEEHDAPAAEAAEVAEPIAREDTPAEPSVPREATSERIVVIDTPLYRAAISNRGGRVVSWTLADYEDSQGDPLEVLALGAAEHLDRFPLDVTLGDPSRDARLQGALFEVSHERRGDLVRLTEDEEVVLSLSWADGQGLEVHKTLTFRGGAYPVDVEISAREHGEEIAKSIVLGAGIGRETQESHYRGVEKGVIASRGEIALFDAGDVEEGGASGVSVRATGVASHYFAGLMVPAGEGFYGARLDTGVVPRVGEDGPRERQAIWALLESPQGTASFTLFLGPKKLEVLEALQPGLGEIIEFGAWMRYPALLLRSGLLAIQDHVGNYGWSIVLLTVVINVLLLPLKHYSFVSMRRMQKLAPQVQHIRERYKKVKPTDPRYQQMNQEIMGLYKEHNVSPVSGCLPMLLMIPFFFAFYRLLMASIELRQAHFVFWISDLSQHDPMFVLPILMGGSQLAIQKMTPQTSADPMQQRIMALMPVVFTFILAWAPSGLVLYWLSNNVVSMGQQLATNRYLASKEEAVEAEREAEKAERKRRRKGKKGAKTA